MKQAIVACDNSMTLFLETILDGFEVQRVSSPAEAQELIDSGSEADLMVYYCQGGQYGATCACERFGKVTWYQAEKYEDLKLIVATEAPSGRDPCPLLKDTNVPHYAAADVPELRKGIKEL